MWRLQPGQARARFSGVVLPPQVLPQQVQVLPQVDPIARKLPLPRLGQMIVDGKTTGGIARGALTSGGVYCTAQGVTLARVAEYASRPRPGVSQLLQG